MSRSLFFRFPQIKYSAERFLAVPVLIAAMPVIIMLALISFIRLGEFPFFFQMRSLHLSGRSFRIYKIRTLRSSAHVFNCENILIRRDMQKLTGGFCGWMRKSGLDELPQLINVIRGEMSLVGPRPLNHEDLLSMQKSFPEIYSGREEMDIRPGITGLWQVHGKREKGIAGLIELDKKYCREVSFFLDLRIIFKTVDLLMQGKKSDAIVF